MSDQYLADSVPGLPAEQIEGTHEHQMAVNERTPVEREPIEEVLEITEMQMLGAGLPVVVTWPQFGEPVQFIGEDGAIITLPETPLTNEVGELPTTMAMASLYLGSRLANDDVLDPIARMNAHTLYVTIRPVQVVDRTGLFINVGTYLGAEGLTHRKSLQ